MAGAGDVHVRARTHFEDVGKGDRQAIIITELPYQVNKARLIERIADLVRDKLIDGIASDGLRDESDKDGMRVVIELKRGEVPEVLLNNLYAQTRDGDRCSASTWSRSSTASRACCQPEGDARRVPAPSPRESSRAGPCMSCASARERGHILEGLSSCAGEHR